jgi:hypothetical protein
LRVVNVAIPSVVRWCSRLRQNESYDLYLPLQCHLAKSICSDAAVPLMFSSSQVSRVVGGQISLAKLGLVRAGLVLSGTITPSYHDLQHHPQSSRLARRVSLPDTALSLVWRSAHSLSPILPFAARGAFLHLSSGYPTAAAT